MLTTTYGDRAAARAAADRVRKIHERVRGTDPVTGKPYAASDPALLIWVHAALVESGLAAAARYGLALTPAEQDQYVAEMTAAAELVGVPAAGFAEAGRPRPSPSSTPTSTAVRPSLATSQSTEDTATYLIGMPDVEPELADVWQVLAAAAVASLPGWARAMYGFGARRHRPTATRCRRSARRSARSSASSTRSTSASPACSRPASGSRCGCARRGGASGTGLSTAAGRQQGRQQARASGQR